MKHFLNKYSVRIIRWNQVIESEFYADTLQEINKTIKADFKSTRAQTTYFKKHCTVFIDKADSKQYNQQYNDKIWIPLCNRIYHSFRYKPFKSLSYFTNE